MGLHEGTGKKFIRVLRIGAPVFDILFAPLTLLAGIWFRIAKFWSLKKLPITKSIFLKLGVFPIVDHYYEPLFDYRKIGDRKIQSHLDFNLPYQLDLLKQFTFDAELNDVPQQKVSDTQFHFNNGSFEDIDVRFYYALIRKNKPSRILEVGSGFSTLLALQAIAKNKAEDPNYTCEMTCIEPYEMPYLEKLDVKLIRKKVEDVDPSVFSTLGVNDILFIDSSHIIRPGGDVTYLFLAVLPKLSSGVWVHVHDIFLPEDYPVAWLQHEFRMWNEQYLLEAFLSGNKDFEVTGAINLLSIRHREELLRTFPGKGNGKGGSFWIRKK